MAVTTKIIMQQLLATDQGAVTASKFPRYVVSLGNSISSITAAELTDAVNKANAAATDANASKVAAKQSETNAKTSETNSKTSETNSKNSEIAAAASAAVSGTRMPWYRLPNLGAGGVYKKVAELRIPGQGANHLNLIISGSSSYGNPMHQTETVTVSARNLSGSVDITQASSVMRHVVIAADNRFRDMSGRVRWGVVKNAGILELWVQMPAFINGCYVGITAYTPDTTTLMFDTGGTQTEIPAGLLLAQPNWNYSVDNPPAALDIDAVRRSGDTMTGDLTIGPVTRISSINLGGGTKIRGNSNTDSSLVISTPNGATGDIIFRPSGDQSSTGEVRIRGSVTGGGGRINTLEAAHIISRGIILQTGDQSTETHALVKYTTLANDIVARSSTIIDNTTDWNTPTFRLPGLYKVQNGATDNNANGPTWAGQGFPGRTSKVYGYGVLVTFSPVADAEYRTVQTYYPHRSGEGIWYRIYNAGQWFAWNYLPSWGDLKSTFIRSDMTTDGGGVTSEWKILGSPSVGTRQSILRFQENADPSSTMQATIFTDNTGQLRVRPGDASGRTTSFFPDGSVNFTPLAASSGVTVNGSKVVSLTEADYPFFVVAATSSAAQWVRLGTVRQLFQGGNTLDIEIIGSGGYNARVNNTGITHIQCRTNNGQGSAATPYDPYRASAVMHNIYGQATTRTIMVETAPDVYDIFALFPPNTRNIWASVRIKSITSVLAQWTTVNTIVNSADIPSAGRQNEIQSSVNYLSSDATYSSVLNNTLTLNGTSATSGNGEQMIRINSGSHTPLVLNRAESASNLSIGFQTSAGFRRLGVDADLDLSWGVQENQALNPKILTTANAKLGAWSQGASGTYTEAEGVPWNAPSGVYQLTRAGGPDQVLHSYFGNTDTLSARALQIRARYGNNGLWFRTSRDKVGFEVDWTKIYTSRQPPTASEVGALSSTGGTITGETEVTAKLIAKDILSRSNVQADSFSINDSQPIPPYDQRDVAGSYWPIGFRMYNTANTTGYYPSALMAQFRLNENRHFQIMANPSTQQLAFRTLHVNNSDPAFIEIFHKKRPPTAAEVGAYSKVESDATFQKISASDSKLKENVRYSLSSATDKIRKIRVFEFDFISTAPTSVAGKHFEHGFVAQQLSTVDGNFVSDNGSFKYPELLPLVALGIKGVQELAEMITTLQERVAELESKVK